MLAAAERLRRRDDFATTIKTGRRAARGSLVVHVTSGTTEAPIDTDPAQARGESPQTRAGFVVSKAVGNAVVRNLVKRRLRHLVLAQMPALPRGTDLVVRALPDASTKSYAELGVDLTAAIAAALRPRPPKQLGMATERPRR